MVTWERDVEITTAQIMWALLGYALMYLWVYCGKGFSKAKALLRRVYA